MPGRIDFEEDPDNGVTTTIMGQNHHGVDGPRRLVLCFDGTNNEFSGDLSDTNIVKIYEMLDRNVDNQYHYYQPGIGTYTNNPLSSSINPLTPVKEKIDSNLDQGFATSFVSHVMAGYSFIMKHYAPGDKIYIFGFSRGAYTARFLAEMIFWLGLLSKSNEEMIRFAWRTFEAFQKHRDDEDFDKAVDKHMKRRKDASFDPFDPTPEDEPKEFTKVMRFREVFCRPDVPIYFLGLFDCVNSVSQFRIPFAKKTSPYIPFPPASHIRHAVSLTERRIKFRPALFKLKDFNEELDLIEKDPNRTLEEVWFGGNHADCGGGWDPLPNTVLVLSDLPLQWMVSELRYLEQEEKKQNDKANVLVWQPRLLDNLDDRAKDLQKAIALHGKRHEEGSTSTKNDLAKLFHDPLRFRTGTGWLMVLFWWLFEINPVKRYELMDKKWTAVSWPPNYGSKRDVPSNFQVHASVPVMLESGVLSTKRMPNVGGDDHVMLITRFWRWLSGYKPIPTEPKKLNAVESKKLD